MVDRVIEVRGRGLRGGRGLPSGPLGSDSVGAQEFKQSAQDRKAIIDLFGLPLIPVDIFPSISAAYAYAVSNGGGALYFSNRRYTDNPWTTPNTRLSNPNIRLIGAGRPTLAAGRNRYLDGTGTIINGPLYYWADNTALEGFAVDSGADVCSASHGGSAVDGLASFKPDQANWNEINSPNKKGLFVRNIGALCQSPGAPIHAGLFEAYDYADIEDVSVTYGLHGFVGKLRFSNIRGIYAYGQAGGNSGEGEGFLLKGNAYAPLSRVSATGITVEGAFPNDNGIGVQVLAEATIGAGGVTISDVQVYAKSKGIECKGANLADVEIVGAVIESCPIGVTYGDGIKRVDVSKTIINNSARAVVCEGSGDLSNSFNGSKITNISGDCGIDVSASKLDIDNVYFENILASGSHCIKATTGRVRVGKVLTKDGTILSLANSTPNLLNGYAAKTGDGSAGNNPAPWTVLYKTGFVILGGVLTPGTSDTFANLPVWLRPTRDWYFNARVISGATEETRRGVIRSDGDIRIINHPTESGSLIFLDNIAMSDTFLPL